MQSNLLKKLAAELRTLAAEQDRQRMEKSAQVLQAARALALLQKKVLGHG